MNGLRMVIKQEPQHIREPPKAWALVGRGKQGGNNNIKSLTSHLRLHKVDGDLFFGRKSIF